MLCCVVCVIVVVVCVWCVCVCLVRVCVFLCVSVCVCVCCGTLKNVEKNPCVNSKTPPCAHSKRPRVYRHHAHMCFNMCTWCRYTRGRFERTHGDFLNGHTGGRRSSPVLLTRICPRMKSCHVLQRFIKKTFRSFPFSSLRKD